MPFVLTIRERNHSWAGPSPITRTHPTSEAAKAELHDSAELGFRNGSRSTDPDEMVDEYFSEVLEAYEIIEIAALGAGPPMSYTNPAIS